MSCPRTGGTSLRTRLAAPHCRPGPRQEGRDDAGWMCRREPHHRRASHGHAQPGGRSWHRESSSLSGGTRTSADGFLSEVVLPVECCVEAIPGLFVLLAATEEDASLHPGDVVAEVRAGLVETAACECGAVETVFRTEPQANPCKSCGISKLAKHEESCYTCGSTERVAARSFQGCSSFFWMGAERSEDRCHRSPCRSLRLGKLRWRECPARNSSPGSFSRRLPVQLHCARPVVGRAGTWRCLRWFITAGCMNQNSRR